MDAKNDVQIGLDSQQTMTIQNSSFSPRFHCHLTASHESGKHKVCVVVSLEVQAHMILSYYLNFRADILT
jgi:hypothetical protein